jgi:hypothetical protein
MGCHITSQGLRYGRHIRLSIRVALKRKHAVLQGENPDIGVTIG